LAYISLCQRESEFGDAMNWIQVIFIATGDLIWQQPISTDMSLRAWTVNGDYLLLSRQMGFNIEEMSIWHLASDGTSSLEMVVEQGLFLSIVP